MEPTVDQALSTIYAQDLNNDDTMVLYERHNGRLEPIGISRERFSAILRYAAYRFWVCEHRMPVALVLSREVAQKFLGYIEDPWIGDLGTYGFFQLDDECRVPVLAREAATEPLYLFL